MIKNVCFNFFYNFRLQIVPFYEELSEIWSKMCVDRHVKYPLLLPVFNKI